ncbi:hypothetical protein Tco_0212895 [Tanacetum coccineum]
MLDSYISSMCNDSWGRSSFARCLIEINSEDDLVDVVTIGIPSLTGDGFTKETIRIDPPIVTNSTVVTPAVEKSNDSFQTVGKKKKRKGKSKSTNGEDEDEAVENVYDESANLFPNTKTSGNSSFTAAAG